MEWPAFVKSEDVNEPVVGTSSGYQQNHVEEEDEPKQRPRKRRAVIAERTPPTTQKRCFSSSSSSNLALDSDLEDVRPSTSSLTCVSIDKKLSTIVGGTFFKILKEKSTADRVVALCLKCLPREVEIKGHANSSSNYLSHLKRIHGEKAIEEYKSYLLQNKNTSRKAPRNKSVQEKFDSNILKFVIHSTVALSVVDDPYFKRIFYDLNISQLGLTVSSRSSLSRKMDNLFQSSVELLKEKLKHINFVCTTADIWSGRRRRFLCITAHWIEENTLRRGSAAVACRRLGYCDDISELITEIHNEFGLYISKVRAKTTDNGSNFVKAFTEFGVNDMCVEREDFEDCDLDSSVDNDDSILKTACSVEKASTHVELPNYIKCCAHTLISCSSADISNTIHNDEKLRLIHESAMAKCNLLWRKASYPESAEVLEELLGHSLTRPRETRWNSLYDALKQIIELGAKCSEVFQTFELKTTFSEDEFSYIEEHLTCTEPVAKALDILHDEHQTYYGSIIPVILSLISKLENKLCQELKFCRPIVLGLLNSVRSRFREFIDCSTTQSLHAAIASVAHPQFKDRWFTLIPESQRTKIMKSFKEAISAEWSPTELARREDAHSPNSDFFAFGDDIKPRVLETEIQVGQYLRDHRQTIDMLESYPEVKKVFVKYNTPLSSSAPVEKLLNFASMANLIKADKLSDSCFESRTILKANSHLIFNEN